MASMAGYRHVLDIRVVSRADLPELRSTSVAMLKVALGPDATRHDGALTAYSRVTTKIPRQGTIWMGVVQYYPYRVGLIQETDFRKQSYTAHKCTPYSLPYYDSSSSSVPFSGPPPPARLLRSCELIYEQVGSKRVPRHLRHNNSRDDR